MSKAVVAGGGIAGLATAVALGRRGWEVEVLERADSYEEVGAGISLWGNAMKALQYLGLADAVGTRALLEGQAGIRDHSGRWLSLADNDTITERYGPTAMVHRADLLEVVREAVPASALRTGVTVHDVDPEAGVVSHSGGTSSGDLVVGADGIRSTVRRSIMGKDPAPRFAGYSAWRAVTAPVDVTGGSESWGRGERFGLAPLPDGRVYWFAVVNSREGEPSGGLDEVRRRFGHWHDPIPALIEATSEDALLYHDLYDLPPLPSYVRGRTALVGDAAHAMTPNLGQGGCVSLEDAVVLARVLEKGGSLETYDEARRARSQSIAARARRLGFVAQWESPLLVKARNSILRAMPQSSFLRTLDPVLTWS